MDRFLLQVNANIGYANIMDNGRYENTVWMNKPRDRDHSEVKPGDELLVYCTSTVPNYGKSLAFRVKVKDVSEDHVTFWLEDPYWFPTRLGFTDIRSLVAEGKLSDTFRSCGAQGFNITRLNPPETKQILELYHFSLRRPHSWRVDSGPLPLSNPIRQATAPAADQTPTLAGMRSPPPPSPRCYVYPSLHPSPNLLEHSLGRIELRTVRWLHDRR